MTIQIMKRPCSWQICSRLPMCRINSRFIRAWATCTRRTSMRCSSRHWRSFQQVSGSVPDKPDSDDNGRHTPDGIYAVASCRCCGKANGRRCARRINCYVTNRLFQNYIMPHVQTHQNRPHLPNTSTHHVLNSFSLEKESQARLGEFCASDWQYVTSSACGLRLARGVSF